MTRKTSIPTTTIALTTQHMSATMQHFSEYFPSQRLNPWIQNRQVGRADPPWRMEEHERCELEASGTASLRPLHPTPRGVGPHARSRDRAALCPLARGSLVQRLDLRSGETQPRGPGAHWGSATYYGVNWGSYFTFCVFGDLSIKWG